MRTSNHDVEIGITNRSANLIEIPRRRKRRIGAEYRQLPFFCQSGRRRSGRLLGNSHAQPAVHAIGLALVELADGDRSGAVEAETDYALVVTIVGQRLPESHARR